MSGVITDYHLDQKFGEEGQMYKLRDGSDGKFSSRKRQNRVRGEGEGGPGGFEWIECGIVRE